ncbi:hypothetical protein [Aliikangiella sp. G2MR2-5]|uniref:hypothetical protein n=1 Tax=Aliikangiella sp. G2MR2-5 TaxID=2788943 RepID=UPI001AEE4229|nr:hypothetical protein [Aliikangiella sp. G2MR2-5]
MDWMKIGSAILLTMFIFMVFPRVRQELKHGKKGSQQEWMGALALLGGVALFVWLLMQSV